MYLASNKHQIDLGDLLYCICTVSYLGPFQHYDIGVVSNSRNSSSIWTLPMSAVAGWEACERSLPKKL